MFTEPDIAAPQEEAFIAGDSSAYWVRSFNSGIGRTSQDAVAEFAFISCRTNVLLRILAETLERAHRFEFWFVSDLLPIFLANILIDLNYVRIKRIKAVLLTA